ncbi:hypothetical protein E2C01_080996 [Portunus trituberculatus]|uniref:Uncharacterized protein n=1 Tax=Portunus trituberculatus TaxID=210409 RepID=A0A5B7INP7_PORTR|nr:hypothetical protein [Portunus trituberculatus]
MEGERGRGMISLAAGEGEGRKEKGGFGKRRKEDDWRADRCEERGNVTEGRRPKGKTEGGKGAEETSEKCWRERWRKGLYGEVEERGE